MRPLRSFESSPSLKPRLAETLGKPPRHLAVVCELELRAAPHTAPILHSLHGAALSVRDAGTEYLTICGAGATAAAGLRAATADEIYALAQRFRDAGVRVCAVGEIDEMPARERHALESLIVATRQETRLTLTLVLPNDARPGLVQATRALAALVRAGLTLPEEIDEYTLRNELGTGHLPDVDLLFTSTNAISLQALLLFEARRARVVVSSSTSDALTPLQLSYLIHCYRASQSARPVEGSGLEMA